MLISRPAVTFAALVLATFSWIGYAESQTVTRGPYLQMGSDDSVTVRWRTDVQTDSRVRFGPNTSQLDSSEDDPGLTTEHAITLSNLQADTEYFYDIGTTSLVLAGDASYHFTTAPVPGPANPTRVWVIGDSGTANSNALAVRDAYKSYTGAQGTDLWLMLGDNAYPDGTDSEYQAAVFDTYPELLRQIVLWPTLGNHDGHSANSADETGPYYDIFNLPRNGEVGGLASGTEAYYSFDHANIHFIVLDSYETSRAIGGPMFTWMENDIAQTTADWVIAFWHHPPYTKGSHNSDTESTLIQMRERALPILEDFGVDLVLSGHSHSYERSVLLDGHYGDSTTLTAAMILNGGDGTDAGDGIYTKSGGGGAPAAGAVYAVAGSSGKTSSSGTLAHPAMYRSLRELGSMVLDINGNRLDAVFIDETGAVRDSFTIENGPDVTPPVMLSVEATGANSVDILYAEAVDSATATDASNYAIDNNVTVNAASLSADDRSVTLDTTQITEGVLHTLTVNNVEDLAGNVIDADSEAQFTFVNIVVIEFQNGVAPDASYQAMVDAHIREEAIDADTNYGNSTLLFVDGSDPSPYDVASLLAWDVSDVPLEAVVEAVDLEVDVVNPTSSTYEIYEAKRSWVESQVTWNQAATGVAWQAPGAQGPNDSGSTVLGTFGFNGTGSYATSLNSDGIALVQAWVDGTAPNFGLIIADSSATDGVDLSSSEHGTPTLRPKLRVRYSLPPTGNDTTPPSAPTNLASTGTTQTSISLSWDAPPESDVAGYKIYRDEVQTGTTSATSHTETGLSADTPYEFVITAYDEANNESDGSLPLMVTTDPVPPQELVYVNDVDVSLKTTGKKFVSAIADIMVVVDQNQVVSAAVGAIVDGEWSGVVPTQPVSGVTDATGTVSFSSEKVSKNANGEFKFTVTNVSFADAVYDQANNNETSDCVDTTGNSGCTTGPDAPPVPTGLTATPDDNAGTIALDWNAVTDPEFDHYEVFRSTDMNGGFVSIATPLTDAYLDADNLAFNTTYYYKVRTVDTGSNVSADSETVSASLTDGSVTAMDATVVVDVVPDRKHWRGRATVTVIDRDTAGTVMDDATVTGHWELESGGVVSILGTASGTTASGSSAVVMESGKERAQTGDIFRFIVDTVARQGYAYLPVVSPRSGENPVP